MIKKNSGKSYVHGAELDGFCRVTPQYVLYGNYTFQRGEIETYAGTSNQTKLEPLSRVMPATLNLNAPYESTNDHYLAAVLYTLAKRQDRINSGDNLDGLIGSRILNPNLRQRPGH